MNVEIYIDELPEEQKQIALILDELISTFPEVTSKIRYRIPFYYRKSWICYINPQKKGGVELCFLRANEMSNASGILDFKGRTQVAGITILHPRDINLEAISEVLQEALLLDDTVKYVPPGKRKKG